jgi:hypothetical protein
MINGLINVVIQSTLVEYYLGIEFDKLLSDKMLKCPGGPYFSMSNPSGSKCAPLRWRPFLLRLGHQSTRR